MAIDPSWIALIQSVVKSELGISLRELLGDELYNFITRLQYSTGQEAVSTYCSFHEDYLEKMENMEKMKKIQKQEKASTSSVNGGNEGQSSNSNVEEDPKGKGKQELEEFPTILEGLLIRNSNGTYPKKMKTPLPIKMKKIHGEASTSSVNGRNEGQSSNQTENKEQESNGKLKNVEENGNREEDEATVGTLVQQTSRISLENGKKTAMADKWDLQRYIEIDNFRLPSARLMGPYGYVSSEDEEPKFTVDESEYRTACRNHFENWKKKKEEQEAVANSDFAQYIDNPKEKKNKNLKKPKRKPT